MKPGIHKRIISIHAAVVRAPRARNESESDRRNRFREIGRLEVVDRVSEPSQHSQRDSLATPADENYLCPSTNVATREKSSCPRSGFRGDRLIDRSCSLGVRRRVADCDQIFLRLSFRLATEIASKKAREKDNTKSLGKNVKTVNRGSSLFGFPFVC